MLSTTNGHTIAKKRMFAYIVILLMAGVFAGALIWKNALATCSSTNSSLCVNSISQTAGPTTGGQNVTITGSGFPYSATTYTDGTNTYAPMSYLQSTGTQYINTGVASITSGTMTLETTYQATATSTTESIIMGAGNSTSTSDPGVFLSQDGSTNRAYFHVYTCTSGTNCWLRSGVLTGQNTITGTLNITSNQYSLSVNGATIATQTSPPPATTAPSIIGLFASGNGAAIFPGAQMSAASITINGTVVRNFTPVYNMATGEGGMFDTINNKFYGNAGTGAFNTGSATNVSIGGAPCTNLQVVGANTITCTTGAHMAGLTDVSLTSGSDTATLDGAYTYQPSVTSVNPNVGSTLGGNTVTVTGKGFAYTSMEYLEFTGAQYINTGQDQLGDVQAWADYQIDASPGDAYQFVWGVQGSDYAHDRFAYYRFNSTDANTPMRLHMAATYGNAGTANWNNMYRDLGVWDANRHQITMHKGDEIILTA
ncbi:MAG: IPT/TIG domain-containing protein [Candidatus Nomurabacteria bacterium]|jgi:hypothetical protein|nr:IPT/TIG domain-containing protein [Candidatus Nomurabacteria bacterium]